MRPERLLLVAFYDPTGLNTIAENIRELGRLSRFAFHVLNLFPSGAMEIPSSLRLRDYDGILIHCTVSYDVESLLRLDRCRDEKIAAFEGVKIVMKQDEHFRTNRLIDWVATRRCDLLLSCLPGFEVPRVYSKERLPRTRVLESLTGYVSDAMRALRYDQRVERPIDIGYRGSSMGRAGSGSMPYSFGRLCYEKGAIGELFKGICEARGLVADISSRLEDRVHGPAWLDFLGRSKATLGVESGTTLFDFDGEVELACERLLAANPACTFEEAFEKILAKHEGNVDYRVISPRHFEAAACRTVQILYEGRYSGIFQAGRHYLSLRRDLANLDEVLERFANPGERVRMTDAAFDEIITNPRYHYSTFVRALDDAVEEIFDARKRA